MYQVKLPISGHAGRASAVPLFHRKENLSSAAMSCGSMPQGDLLCNCRLNEASSPPQNFQRSLVIGTVRRPAFCCRDHDPRARTHVDVAFHLQGNQRFAHGRPGDAESLGQFSFGGKTTPGKNSPAAISERT